MLTIYAINPDTEEKHVIGNASPFTDSSGYHVLFRPNQHTSGVIEIRDNLADQMPSFIREIDEDNQDIEPPMYLYTLNSQDRSEHLIAKAEPLSCGTGYKIELPYGVAVSGAMLIHPDRRTMPRALYIPTPEERDELKS